MSAGEPPGPNLPDTTHGLASFADADHGANHPQEISGDRDPHKTPGSSPHLSGHGGRRYRRWLIFPPALAALLAIWVIVAGFTAVERGATLERAQSQLDNTASTLLELSVLAELAAQIPGHPDDPDRMAAFWQILLQYPTAWIWIEKGGTISVGQAPPRGVGHLIVAAAASGDMSAHAALARADALKDWRRSVWWRVAVMLISSVGFLLLADQLSRALTQRAIAEESAARAEDRAIQLNVYKKQLEDTVTQRTAELRQANILLQKELSERIEAEAALHRHDALLTAVTLGAAALLGERDLNDAILTVLALVGETMSVSRVQFSEVRPDPAGHLLSFVRHEWCASGVTRLPDDTPLKEFDLTARFPDAARRLLAGEQISAYSDDLIGLSREQFEAAQMKSILLVPIRVDNEFAGILNFADSVQPRRTWIWAETDTAATLAELVGSAIARARRIKELADANMIVQNSPTILFRLRGEPSLPLIYISQNISKFGYSPTDLTASPTWPLTLIDPDDRDRVWSALTGVLANDALSASIEFRVLNGDRSRRWVEARYSPVRDKSGRLIEIEGIMTDVTERKAAETKILLLARTDPLTGLANRATFAERLHLAFSASRRGGSSFAVLYLDLDHFKDVNDTLGHPTGDLLLQAVAARLVAGVRDLDLVARFGGDEFAILQTDVGDPAIAGTLAEKLRVSVDRPYTFNGNTMHVTASIGIATLGAEIVDSDTMLAQADLALYRAKDEGRDQFRFHTKDLDEEVRERVSLTSDLRDAIERTELELYYQPQVDLASGTIVGMEALARWHHPTRGLIMPSTFISIAEKSGVIIPFGRWVLEEACGQMRRWRDTGIAPPVMAVNISMLQLKNARQFITLVTEVLSKRGLVPGDLELDVTEAILAQVSWARNDVLMDLRKMGVRIAIDDFGTGYSSFDYLRKYHINHIKIARSFINSATDDPEYAQTVRAIIGLARDLQIDVIAEGVETAAEREFLVSAGATTKGQGFFFSAAVNEAEASDLLRKGMITPASSPSGPVPGVRAISPAPLIPAAAQ